MKAGEPEPEAQEADGQGRRRFVLLYYSIFNTEQCELPATISETLMLPEQRQLNPIEACEAILAGMPNPPQIVHAGDKAFYSPLTDRLTMPPRGLFENADEYWSTLWHEESHAVGHTRRLNRESIQEVAPFGIRYVLRRRNSCGDDSRLSVRNYWYRKPHDRQLRRLHSRVARVMARLHDDPAL